jgi:hypothetical protein
MLSNKEKQKLFKILILGATVITLVMTPNINKDSIIIPKNIILFSLSMFFSVLVIKYLRNMLKNSTFRKLIFIITLILTNSLIIIFTSESPLEQLLFGRTGRGLGFFTQFSILIILISAGILARIENIRVVLGGMVICGTISGFYGILQYLDLDLFNWDTRTNGVIGTIGNPNFLSSFSAMILIPTIVIFWNKKLKYCLIVILPIILFTIYITVSTQGYVAIAASVLCFLLIFTWYSQKIIFISTAILSFTSIILATFGALGHGPLSYFLYKRSVQSRGDFWRSAVNTGNSNPFFGVGFDSFGDYSLLYRDQIAASHSFAEYTDSAHNYLLDYLTVGGYPFLVLQVILILFVLMSFVKLQKEIATFNKNITALFCAWLVFQLQSIISPASTVFMVWNGIISGTVIGLISHNKQNEFENKLISKNESFTSSLYSVGLILSLIGLIIMYPFFNTDRLQLKAMRSGNGDLLIQAVTSYPESVLKYSQAGRDLLSSGLPDHSLYLARKAVEFNPNSAALWSLILINPKAPLNERLNAKKVIMQLDPLNTDVSNFEVQ